MKLKQALILSSLAGLTLFAASPAHADPVTDAGSTYNLTYSPQGGNIYDFVLTIDTNGYNAGDTTNLLNAVAINVAKDASDYTSFSVLSAPAGYATALQNGALGAGGCNDNNSAYLCLAYVGSGNGVAVDGNDGLNDTYIFVFQIGVADASDLTTKTGAANIKAVYDTAGATKFNGSTTDTYTEDVTLTQTPEPSSLALLGTGIIGMAGAFRRRFRA